MSARPAYDTASNGPLSTSDAVEFAPGEPDPAFGRLLESPTRKLDSGRAIRVDSSPDGVDHVTIHGVDGHVELQVTLTDKGPVLHFKAAEIKLESAGRLSVQCDEYEVVANNGIRHLTDGDLVQTVAGDASLIARGDLVTSARQMHMQSTRGDVRIRANDDVRLNGERVKLNC